MTAAEDKNLTYVQEGLLASILLNSGAADFVVTGCGTGEGAMLALNSFPGVFLWSRSRFYRCLSIFSNQW